MSSVTFNLLDIAFVAVTIIFVITAIFRGFVKEIFALTNWAISITISYLLAPHAEKLLSSWIKSEMINYGLSRFIIFLVSFLILHFSTSKLCSSIRSMIPPLLDKLLGVLFAIVKSIFIFAFICCVVIHCYKVIGKKMNQKIEYPLWLTASKTYNATAVLQTCVDSLAKIVVNAVIDNFGGAISPSKNSKDALDQKIKEIMNKKDGKESENLDDVGDASSLDNQDVQDYGYNKKDIDKMQHLIEIIQKK